MTQAATTSTVKTTFANGINPFISVRHRGVAKSRVQAYLEGCDTPVNIQKIAQAVDMSPMGVRKVLYAEPEKFLLIRRGKNFFFTLDRDMQRDT